jgi:cell shape-determining protein MreC
MKKFQIRLHKILLLLSCLFVSPALFAVTEAEAIWSYVFLMPLYFILILQSILILIALTMKQFKEKKLLTINNGIGSVVAVLGIAVTIFFHSLINVGLHVLYFIVLAIIVLALPTIQYKLLNKSKNSADQI